MIGWKDISLLKFQQIDEINTRKDLSDIDKTLFSICPIFDLTPDQLNNAGARRANKYLLKTKKLFSQPIDHQPEKKIGRYYLNYNPGSMTFGQFIELAFFVERGTLQNAHNILASISHEAGLKNIPDEHKEKAEYFLTQPILKIVGSIAEFVKQFNKFNNEYKGLFGVGTEAAQEIESNPFHKKYGWIYSVSMVAEYERIALEQAYGINVRQAFHDLAYLKAKAQFDEQQIKRSK
jgi:hypothetical protein